MEIIVLVGVISKYLTRRLKKKINDLRDEDERSRYAFESSSPRSKIPV